MISHSLEWQSVRKTLLDQAGISKLDCLIQRDLFRLINNIDNQVAELSKWEVQARNLKKIAPEHKKMLKKVNDSIDNFQQYLTLASLLA